MKREHVSVFLTPCMQMSQESVLQAATRGQRSPSMFNNYFAQNKQASRTAGNEMPQLQLMCESFQLGIQRACCLMKKWHAFLLCVSLLPWWSLAKSWFHSREYGCHLVHLIGGGVWQVITWPEVESKVREKQLIRSWTRVQGLANHCLGQMWSTTCFCKSSFIGTQPHHLFVYYLRLLSLDKGRVETL